MPATKPYLCKHCGETEPEKFFQQNKMKSCCLKCHTLYVHQKQRELKVKAIEYLGGKCKKCGYVGISAVYDFHHRDPGDKDFSWGNRRTSNWENLKLELDKCDLLCSNCHREVHDDGWFNNLPNHHPEKLRRLNG
jgi:hypothetical protein